MEIINIFNFRYTLRSILLIVYLVFFIYNCSAQNIGFKIAANALSGGTGVFMRDDDPDLIKEAMPFGLKTYEAILEKNPNHKPLLLSTATGFCSYAYLLQNDAEQIIDNNYDEHLLLKSRAKKLYIRCRNYALRALEIDYPGFQKKIQNNNDTSKSILSETNAEDSPYLYWAGAGWVGAINLDKSDTGMLIDLPTAGMLLERVIQINDTFNEGAAYDLLLSYEASRPGGDLNKARHYYNKALNISKGKRAALYLNLAENVSVREQNLEEFKNLLDRALSLEVNAYPELTLENSIAQRRALWLKKITSDLFL